MQAWCEAGAGLARSECAQGTALQPASSITPVCRRPASLLLLHALACDPAPGF